MREEHQLGGVRE